MKKKEIILTLSPEDRVWLEELIRQLVSARNRSGFKGKIRYKGHHDDRKTN